MNRVCTVYALCIHCLRIKKILKMDPTVLFTHLKIILLQCFQFSVLAIISSIQTDPIYILESSYVLCACNNALFYLFIYLV